MHRDLTNLARSVELLSPARPDVSAIVLTWNSQRFISGCFRSLQGAVDGLKHELIVVDNGSRDAGLEILLDIVPQARVIRNPVNRGVAAARNQGLAAARGRYLWLLDVDTCFLAGDMRGLIEFMDCHPQIGLAGCRLLYPDGSLQPSCRRFPTVTSKISRRLPGRSSALWSGEEYYSQEWCRSIQEVDYVIGAYQLIRREAFENAGYLDERIFYGPEDADYCLRLWQRGWKVVYYPHVSVLHHEQRITRRRLASAITWKHFVGLVHYFHKHGYWFSREKAYRQAVYGRGVEPGAHLELQEMTAPER